MAEDRIIAVGFLTSTDLAMLRERFNRYFPIEHDDVFDDLLRQLDNIEAAPVGKGVSFQVKRED